MPVIYIIKLHAEFVDIKLILKIGIVYSFAGNEYLGKAVTLVGFSSACCLMNENKEITIFLCHQKR